MGTKRPAPTQEPKERVRAQRLDDDDETHAPRRVVLREVVDDFSIVSAPHSEDAQAVVTTLVPVVRRAQKKYMPALAALDAPFEMVYTAVLGTSVRLPHVAVALAKAGAELNQKRFSAVILRTYLNCRMGNAADVMLQQLEPVLLMRPRLDKIAVLVFRNGNLVCTGAKTFSQAQYQLLKTAQMLRDIGYEDASIVRMNIRNMVGRAQLPCRINRERMARELSAYVTYDPEHFPGAVVRHPLTWPITLLIFDSGRVVVTGTKSKARADAVLARIKPLLMHFNVDTLEGTPMPTMSRVGNAVDTALYDMLDVKPDATAKDIRKAFHDKAKVLHPDKNHKLKKGSSRYEKNMRRYRRIDAAYRVLSNVTTRETYDLTGEWVDSVLEDATDAEGEGESDIDSDAEADAEEAVKAAMGEHDGEDDVDAALNEFLKDIRG